MFNERALKQRQMKPKNAGMDVLDREAEREGSARRFFTNNGVGPSVLGKRIAKQSRQMDGASKTAEKRATTNLVADTAAAAKRVMVPQLRLAQH